MGYIHDTAMSQFVPPADFQFSAGTWAIAVASNVWSMDRTANDSTFTAYFPIPILSNSAALKGAKLESIEVMYSIATTLADDFVSVTLYKDTLAVDGTFNSAASVTTTEDAAHDSAAERKAIDEHRMVITLSTPVWIDDDEAFHLEFVVDCHANTVFKCFGAIINYTLRL
jgi:hypothetical protein